ncbi:MAG: hypothetical protein AABX79_00180 [Nanoarchaeota archaeon]
MRDLIKFIFFGLAVFLIMGGVTFIEIKNFSLFESAVSYIKTPASWFIGLSLAFIFSYFLKNFLASFFRRKITEEYKRKDFFAGFIIATVIASFILPYARQATLYFFDNLLPYFHIIVLQSLIIFYLLFKISEKYEISGRYFLASQVFVLIYTIIVLTSVG